MCDVIKTSDGFGAIVCGSRRHAKPCAYCGSPSATLCDGPLPDGVVHRRSATPGADTTCSRPLCRACAIHVPPDQDFCKANPRCRAAAIAAGAELRDRSTAR